MHPQRSVIPFGFGVYSAPSLGCRARELRSRCSAPTGCPPCHWRRTSLLVGPLCTARCVVGIAAVFWCGGVRIGGCRRRSAAPLRPNAGLGCTRGCRRGACSSSSALGVGGRRCSCISSARTRTRRRTGAPCPRCTRARLVIVPCIRCELQTRRRSAVGAAVVPQGGPVPLHGPPLSIRHSEGVQQLLVALLVQVDDELPRPELEARGGLPRRACAAGSGSLDVHAPARRGARRRACAGTGAPVLASTLRLVARARLRAGPRV